MLLEGAGSGPEMGIELMLESGAPWSFMCFYFSMMDSVMVGVNLGLARRSVGKEMNTHCEAFTSASASPIISGL
jgi:hypothetical protein